MKLILQYNTVEIITQTVKILTDVQVANSSIICPIFAVLSPLKPFLTLKTDFTLLIVKNSDTNSLDCGTYPFTLTVTSPNWPTVNAVVYNFKLELKSFCPQANFVP